jgi:hypothetical protein
VAGVDLPSTMMEPPCAARAMAEAEAEDPLETKDEDWPFDLPSRRSARNAALPRRKPQYEVSCRHSIFAQPSSGWAASAPHRSLCSPAATLPHSLSAGPVGRGHRDASCA